MKLTTIKSCLAIDDMGTIGVEIAKTGKAIYSTEKKLKKLNVSQWPLTIATVVRCETGFEYDEETGGYSPTAETAAEFNDEYRAFLEATLPEDVLESIQKDKEGEYQFRSDRHTRNAWKYAGSIGRAIEAGVTYEDMFKDPENEGKLPSKSFIESLTKAKKSNLEKLRTILEVAEKIAENMHTDSAADVKAAQELVGELMGKIGMAPEESE